MITPAARSIESQGLASGATHPDLYLAIAVASSLSLATHARATLFDTPSHLLMRPSSGRPSRSSSADAKIKHGARSAKDAPPKAGGAGTTTARTFGNTPLSAQQQNETGPSPTTSKKE